MTAASVTQPTTRDKCIGSQSGCSSSRADQWLSPLIGAPPEILSFDDKHSRHEMSGRFNLPSAGSGHHCAENHGTVKILIFHQNQSNRTTDRIGTELFAAVRLNLFRSAERSFSVPSNLVVVVVVEQLAATSSRAIDSFAARTNKTLTGTLSDDRLTCRAILAFAGWLAERFQRVCPSSSRLAGKRQYKRHTSFFLVYLVSFGWPFA